MTPLARWLRNAWERTFGNFYEGPRVPERLFQLVDEFANAHPKATRREWVAMTKKLVGSTYESGYTRGWESTARDPAAPWRKLPPEFIADHTDPDWRWRPVLGEQLANPDDFVEDELPAAKIDPAGHARNRPRTDDQ